MPKFDSGNAATLFEQEDCGFPAGAEQNAEAPERPAGGKHPRASSRASSKTRSVAVLMSAIELPPPEPDLFRALRAEQSGLPRYRFNFPGGVIR